ncbi:MAG: autoinducer-2 kinase [Epsilonproteobacteria bacterium]|nr:autoinducer-2 kinase [Campylobacterota bacterium]
MNKYLLAIDAGTGSGRAVLFDIKGKQIAVGQEEWTHISEDGVENSMGFDCDANWQLLCRCIHKATAEVDPADILAVSATSMREGIVLYDSEGNALWAVANVDARADAEVKELKEKFPDIEALFYQASGQTFALGALPRLLWVKKYRPEIYEKAAKISMISDWVLARLSGVIASDPSNAATAGIYDLLKREWEPKMAEKIGIRSDIFPPSYETGSVIGTVIDKESGLDPNTKVVMGGGDVQLGSAGLGVVEEGEVAILGGTFWQQIVNIKVPTPPKDMSIRINPHVIPDMCQAEGITFFSGLVMRWFRDALCESEKLFAEKKGVDPYAVLEGMAEHIPIGSYGILPIFSDVMKYGKWYHASPSFLNLGLDPHKYNKASMFRALEENACIVSAENLDNIIKFTGIEVDTIIFAGGASKGFLWPQILADVTGKKVKIPEVKEATALGCAIAAGVGAGVYESIASAAKTLVSWDRSCLPSAENHLKYQEVREKWRKAYAAQLALVDSGVTTSMWKAPGL